MISLDQSGNCGKEDERGRLGISDSGFGKKRSGGQSGNTLKAVIARRP
jgi:hypothetical protein